MEFKELDIANVYTKGLDSYYWWFIRDIKKKPLTVRLTLEHVKSLDSVDI